MPLFDALHCQREMELRILLELNKVRADIEASKVKVLGLLTVDMTITVAAVAILIRNALWPLRPHFFLCYLHCGSSYLLSQLMSLEHKHFIPQLWQCGGPCLER